MRRFHIRHLIPGSVELDAESAHHIRTVLRLRTGTRIELFDASGRVAQGVLARLEPAVVVHVDRVQSMPATTPAITIASAVPKGERADWMIEKLSELGCARFIPLSAARSVVLPEGRNKLERWKRIAIEAAKQSKRPGLMTIEPLTPVAEALQQITSPGVVLSTQSGCQSLAQAIATRSTGAALFIGPEGGWSDEELSRFAARRIEAVRLTHTVLRVETAAIAACAVAVTAITSNPESTI